MTVDIMSFTGANNAKETVDSRQKALCFITSLEVTYPNFYTILFIMQGSAGRCGENE